VDLEGQAIATGGLRAILRRLDGGSQPWAVYVQGNGAGCFPEAAREFDSCGNAREGGGQLSLLQIGYKALLYKLK